MLYFNNVIENYNMYIAILFMVILINLSSSITIFASNSDTSGYWDPDQINSYILTYEVRGTEEEFNNLVDKAFEDWENALQRLTFDKIYPGDYLHSLFGPNIFVQQVDTLNFLPIEAETNTTDKTFDKLGNTKFEYTPDVNIEKANIKILRDVPTNEKYKILLHEIGHALGLGHIDNRTSIMYPFADSNINSLKIGQCEVYSIYSNNYLDEAANIEKRLGMKGEEICK
jgi:Matrixin